MAFDSLSEKLQNVFKGLRSKGRLTEADVKTALKEVKMALLEADVNFKVVKNFVKAVQEKATGEDVLNSLTPGQTVIKYVNEELVSMMGMKTLSKGVKVEVTDTDVKVDLALNLEFEANILKVSSIVQDKVKAAIENMTGMKVSEVNVRVAGIVLE